MGFYSEIDIEIMEMISNGASIKDVQKAYPMLFEHEIESYFDNDHDGDYEATVTEEGFVEDYDDSMDGDAASALASAGLGTDEDYGYYGEDY